jgi:hypothetical protein
MDNLLHVWTGAKTYDFSLRNFDTIHTLLASYLHQLLCRRIQPHFLRHLQPLHRSCTLFLLKMEVQPLFSMSPIRLGKVLCIFRLCPPRDDSTSIVWRCAIVYLPFHDRGLYSSRSTQELRIAFLRAGRELDSSQITPTGTLSIAPSSSGSSVPTLFGTPGGAFAHSPAVRPF